MTLKKYYKNKEKLILILLPAYSFLSFSLIFTSVVFLVRRNYVDRSSLEKIRVSQKAFEEYSKSVLNISSHLYDDQNNTGLDPQLLEKEGVKGSKLFFEAMKASALLSKSLANFKSNEEIEYTNKLKDFISSSQSILLLEKEASILYYSYTEPFKYDAETNQTLSGERLFMYSDPNRFTYSLDKAVVRKSKVIISLKDLKFETKIGLINDLVLGKLKIEKAYLESLKEAVKLRNTDKVVLTEMTYRRMQQEKINNFNLLNLTIKEYVSNTLDSLNSIKTYVDFNYYRTLPSR